MMSLWGRGQAAPAETVFLNQARTEHQKDIARGAREDI